MGKKKRMIDSIWVVLLSILAVLYVYPIIMILFNSMNGGEAVQAASFAYAYKLAAQNPYIKAFIVHRMVDSPYEKASDKIACGLYNCDANGWASTPKQIYDVFKYIDTAQSAAYTNFALPIIGVSSWAQLGLN